MTPLLRGIHHLKLPTADLERAVAFLTEAVAAERLPEADHVRPDGTVYGYILRVLGLDTLVELRLDPDQAAAARGFDPVTFAVEDRAALWETHRDDVPPDADSPWVGTAHRPHHEDNR